MSCGGSTRETPSTLLNACHIELSTRNMCIWRFYQVLPVESVGRKKQHRVAMRRTFNLLPLTCSIKLVFIQRQGCTDFGHQLSVTTEFYTLALNTCGSSVWYSLRITHLVPSILRWLRDFWERLHLSCNLNCARRYNCPVAVLEALDSNTIFWWGNWMVWLCE